jgi:hypothetical protein
MSTLDNTEPTTETEDTLPTDFLFVGDVAAQPPSLEQVLDAFASAQEIGDAQRLEGVPPFDGTYSIDGLLYVVLDERVLEVQLILGTADFQIVRTNTSRHAGGKQRLMGWVVRYNAETKRWKAIACLAQPPAAPRTTCLPDNINALLNEEDVQILENACADYVSRLTESPSERYPLFCLLFSDALSTSNPAAQTPETVTHILDNGLSSTSAIEIGRLLLSALNWYGGNEGEETDTDILKDLVQAALMLELDPLARQRVGYVAGFDLQGPEHWGESYPKRRQELEAFLGRKFADDVNKPLAGQLALRVLSPAIPDFFVEGIPDDLQYGTARWANFAHGVALAEAIYSSSPASLNFEQLLRLPLQLSSEATEDELSLIALTRLSPALQWAVANGVLPNKVMRAYTQEESVQAVTALDEFQVKAAKAIAAMCRDIPDRFRIADREFKKAFGQGYEAGRLIPMRPSTVGARMEYSLRLRSPYAKANQFALFDVFMAGYLKNGDDLFEYDAQPTEIGRPFTDPGIARLTGIDIPKMYEEEFADYAAKAPAAYATLIEDLLSRQPQDDRIALCEGALKIYVLQRATRKLYQSETERDRELHRGRKGFIIECQYSGQRIVYEVFPLAGLVQRRTDMMTINLEELYEQRPSGSRNIYRTAPTLNVDWNAYSEVATPHSGVTSEVIAILIGHYREMTLVNPSLSPARFKHIATLISNNHLFFDRKLKYEQHRHQTSSEMAGDHRPFVLSVAEMLIPGLSCLTAGTKGGSAAHCVMDLGMILLLPAFKFVGGSLSLAGKTGQLGIRTLPAFGKLATTALKSASARYWMALNPAMTAAALNGVYKGIFSNALSKRLNTFIKTQTGRADSYRLASGIPTRINTGTWRPMNPDDALRKVRHVPDVPVRRTRRTAINPESYHLLKPASGRPYGPQLLKKQTKLPLFNPPQRINNRIGYVLSPQPLPTPSPGTLGKRIESADELDAFLKKHAILTKDQKANDLRANIEDNVPMHIYKKKDGSEGLVVRDTEAEIYADAFNNGTVYFGKTYDYKLIRTWEVGAESGSGTIVNIPLGSLIVSRPAMDPARLRSIRKMIQEGIPLPAVKVRKTAGTYEVIDGNHRVTIARQLELETAPAIISSQANP